MDIITEKSFFGAAAGGGQDVYYAVAPLSFTTTASGTGGTSVTWNPVHAAKARNNDDIFWSWQNSTTPYAMGMTRYDATGENIVWQRFARPNTSHVSYTAYGNAFQNISHRDFHLDGNDNVYAMGTFVGSSNYSTVLQKYSGSTGALLAAKDNHHNAFTSNAEPYRGTSRNLVTAHPTDGPAIVQQGIAGGGWYNWHLMRYDTSLNLTNWKPYGAPGKHWFSPKGYAHNQICDAYFPYGTPSIGPSHENSYHIAKLTWSAYGTYSVAWDSTLLGTSNTDRIDAQNAVVNTTWGDVITTGHINNYQGSGWGSGGDGFILYHGGSNGGVVWSYKVGPSDGTQGYNAGPLGVDPTNNEIVACWYGGGDTHIVRFHSNGTVLWKRKISRTMPEGTITFNSNGDIVLCFAYICYVLPGDGDGDIIGRSLIQPGGGTATFSTSTISLSAYSPTTSFTTYGAGTSSPAANFDDTVSTNHFNTYTNLHSANPDLKYFA